MKTIVSEQPQWPDASSEPSLAGRKVRNLPGAQDGRADGANHSIDIFPLTILTMPQAINLIMATFSILPSEVPQMELEESISPGRHTTALAETGILEPRYWVACRDGQVVGVGGLTYHPADLQDAVWGGWTVYAPEWLQSLSRTRFQMLRKLAFEVVACRRKYLRLYTSDVPQEQQANLFYDHLGLKVYKTEASADGKSNIYYRQAEVRDLLRRFHNQFLPEYTLSEEGSLAPVQPVSGQAGEA